MPDWPCSPMNNKEVDAQSPTDRRFSAGWFRARWGWVVCGASFLIHIGIFALGYTYSLFFVDIQRDLNATAVETGWIGSVLFGVQMFSSPVGSFLESCLGYRVTMVLIVLVSSLAIFLSSFAKSVQQLFVTLGVIHGLTVGMSWFIMFAVMVQYFPSKNSVRAVSISTMGATVAMLIISEPVSISIEAVGWRTTLQFIAAFTLATALPPAFLVFPPSLKKETRQDTSSSNENYDSLSPTEEKTGIGSEEKECRQLSGDQSVHRAEDEENVKSATLERSRLQRWKNAVSVGAFLYSVFTITCSMSWSVFFINIVSYYESVGLGITECATLLMVSCSMEIATKILLATLGEKFPYKKTYLLLLKTIMLTGLSVIMILGTSFWYFVALSTVTGFLRACFNVFLYPCGIETFGKDCSDEATVIVSVSRGLGFLTGTLPAGAIYDAMGSYRLSFLLVAAISTCSAVALSMALLHSKVSKEHTLYKLVTTYEGRQKGITECLDVKGRLETSV